MTAPEPLSLRLLGDMELGRGGSPLTLPASKKTRALLAYLAVTAKPHRRERLCALFWDIPDDPRGALRWSLSKLRALVDEPNRPRIASGHETVAFDGADVAIDLLTARRRAQEDASLDELKGTAALFRGEFLEGLDLATCPEFEAWRAAEREEARGLHRRVLTALIERLSTSPGEALVHARALIAIDPYALAAHETLLKLLVSAGRLREAEEQFAVSLRQLGEASTRSARLLGESWRALNRVRSDVPAAAPAEAVNAAPDWHRAALQRSQTIRFCTASDGVRIAYSTVGQGPPLVKAANWLNHLEFDWESPIWRHWIDELSHEHMLVRYDERGNGLSDWDVDDISFDSFVRDFESVIDALKLERFALLGISQGGAVSIAYALKHPERVSHLILYGTYAKGWEPLGDQSQIARWRAMITLTRQGWGQANPAFRQLFSQLFVPDATPQQMDWVNELQRITTSPANAARLQEVFSNINVSALLPRVSVPTLVLHSRHDAFVPYDAGLAIAKRIPGAKFVPLESRNHIVLENEPAWARFVAEVRAFLHAPSPLAPSVAAASDA